MKGQSKLRTKTNYLTKVDKKKVVTPCKSKTHRKSLEETIESKTIISQVKKKKISSVSINSPKISNLIKLKEVEIKINIWNKQLRMAIINVISLKLINLEYSSHKDQQIYKLRRDLIKSKEYLNYNNF
eukprot:GHVR01163570.1.p1 GENE.GHVR01163570.1~~GHVR01163570.1.p1  ORF type:complete len:128 (-),score=1.51 GHVR01163570.1:69-452(-)